MTDFASSADYTPLPAPAPADDGDGPNVVQRSVAGRLWNAGSNAVHHAADWVDHNSSTLTDMAGHGAETLLGGAATIAGGAMVASGAAACAASLPLAATGVGAILTVGACAAGAAEAAAGAAVAAAGIAAMVDGGSKFGHDLTRLERTGNTSGADAAEDGAGALAKIGGPKEFDPNSLKGLTGDQVRSRIPSDWTSGTSKSGGGEVFRDPANPGRQERIMPGYGAGARPDPLTAGPYAVVSQNGVTVKVPLYGNPTLP